MDTERLCKSCGTELSPTSSEGLCPACLLKVAMGTEGGNPGPTSSERKLAPSPEEMGRFFPQLEILELLGQGGMGMVYKARQPQLDRLIALKILSPELSCDPAFAERFNREAKALARLNHPNIVGVYDFGFAPSRRGDEAEKSHAAGPPPPVGGCSVEGFYYFIMEFVDGMNLWELERAKKRLAPEEALAIVPKICDALQYAHDEGIVHRDIKPGNILIDKKGRVKIADFGLAKLVGKQPQDFHLTQTKMTLGTPQYMAPEQLADPQKVDHRADIYSLGVVFYEMLTGDLPIGRFALPSQKVRVDVRLDEVVLRALEHEPGRRYQHASDVKTHVENISGVIENLPAHLRYAIGFEYKSKRTLFGLPLLHVASGVDPQTGKRRVAKGIIAIGDVAKGLIAFGGFAFGGIAFGGGAIGVIPFGGFGFGLFAIGGLAIGLISAYGGCAIAPIAWGGAAFGYLAFGGGAFGVHALGGNANDPVARNFFLPWAMKYFVVINATMIALMLGSIAIGTFLPVMMRRRMLAASANPSSNRDPWSRIIGVLFSVLTLLMLPFIIYLMLAKSPSLLKKQAESMLPQPVALFAPVSDPSLGDSAYRLVTTLVKPRRVAMGVFQFVDEQHSVSITIPRLSFYFVVPDGHSNEAASRMTWTIEDVTTGEGAWIVRATGEKDLARFEQKIILAGDKPFLRLPSTLDNPIHGPETGLDPKMISWRVVRPTRSFWVGPGEWSERDWNSLPLFEASDAQGRIVARMRLQLLVTPIRDNVVVESSGPFLRSGDWGESAELKAMLPSGLEHRAGSTTMPKVPNSYLAATLAGMDLAVSKIKDANERGQLMQLADVFNHFNELCDQIQGKNNNPATTAQDWGITNADDFRKLMRLVASLENDAEGMRSISRDKEASANDRQRLLHQTCEQFLDKYAEFKNFFGNIRSAAPASASGEGRRAEAGNANPSQEGWQLWQAGKYEQATATFREAVRQDPKNANAFNGLGWALLNSGRAQEGKEAFERAVTLQADHPGALNGLGQIYLSEKKYDEAEKLLLKAAPKAPAAWYGLARLYLLQDKFEQAERWAQNIVDAGQADEIVTNMLEAARNKKLSEGLRLVIEPPGH